MSSPSKTLFTIGVNSVRRNEGLILKMFINLYIVDFNTKEVFLLQFTIKINRKKFSFTDDVYDRSPHPAKSLRRTRSVGTSPTEERTVRRMEGKQWTTLERR